MKRAIAKHKLAVKVIVSTALIAFLLTKVSISDLFRIVSSIDPGLVLASMACYFVSNVLGAYQWHLLLASSGIRLRFAQAFQFYFVGLFFNNFLPANIGGDAIKVYDVSRVGSSVYQVIAVTLLDRLLGIFSLCVLALGAVAYVARSDQPGPYGLYVIVFAACMVPALGFYFIKPLGNWLRRTVMRVRSLSLDVRISSVLDHLGKFKGKKPLVLQLVGLSIVIQAMRVYTHILVALALAIPLTALAKAQFFVFVPLLSLAMIPPITINGLGIREGLGIVLFANAGLSAADAFAMEFLTFVASVIVSLVGFLMFVSRRQRAPKEVDRVSDSGI